MTTITDSFASLAGWTADTGSQTAVITAGGRVRTATSGSTTIYYANTQLAAGGDHVVDFDLYAASTVNQGNMGVLVRYTPGASPSFYMGRFNQTATHWEIYKSINGALTLVANIATAVTLNQGQTYACEVSAVGSNPVVVTMKANGSTVATYSDSAADRIVTGTRIGFRGSNASAGDTVGLHLDNVSATDGLGGVPPSTGGVAQRVALLLS
jgi:hypothetical protein